MSAVHHFEPRVVARYQAYTIMIGARQDKYYAYENDVFVGMGDDLDDAIDIIELREGMYFDREDVEVIDEQ